MIEARADSESRAQSGDLDARIVQDTCNVNHRNRRIAAAAFGALAHLGLARADATQGDTAKARAAYKDFLTLWKDADPDIPILVAAKAEYEKVKRSWLSFSGASQVSCPQNAGGNSGSPAR